MIKYKNIIRYGAFFAFFAVSVGFSVITNPATTFADDPPASDQSSDITCAIEKMGWILCPIIETSGKVGDQAFNFLANNFLQTEPELISNSPSGTKAAWELARNLANIMFIIAFLVIILSQVTGQGLNNYGVKKMLPRLVIAAIAVNVSYYICQLMVDLTNILGFEIQRFLVNTAAGVSDKAALPVQTRIDNQTSNGALGSMATGILGITTVVWFLLPMLFLGVGTVVITCIVIIVILLLRKAFIVLLVVVSPIAFVAYILPNTEKLFQKWGRMFWQLLLVFPIVGMLFGGGQLASAIVLVAGSSADAYKDQGGKCIQLPPSKIIDEKGNAPKTNPASTAVKDCDKNGGSTPFLLGLIAAGIAVAPMLAVWSVLKGALSAAGAIGGKISGAVQNAGNKATGIARKPEDALRRAAVGAARTSLTANALKGGFGKGTARFVRRRQTSKARQEARIRTAQATHDATLGADSAMEIAALNQAATAADAGLREKFVQAQLKDQNMIGGKLGIAAQDPAVAKALEAARLGADAAQRKTVADETSAAHLEVDSLDSGNYGTANWATGGTAGAQAQALIDAGNFDSPHLAALLEHLGKTNQQAFMRLASQVGNRGDGGNTASRAAAAVMSSTGLYGGRDVAHMQNGQMTNPIGNTDELEVIARRNVEGGGLSPTDLAKMSNDGLRTLDTVIASTGIARSQVASTFGRMTNEQKNDISEEKIGRLSGF